MPPKISPQTKTIRVRDHQPLGDLIQGIQDYEHAHPGRRLEITVVDGTPAVVIPTEDAVIWKLTNGWNAE